MTEKHTIQRRVIMEELSLLKNHPTADELFQIVRLRLPKISLATVYRNLADLAAAGKIRKTELPGEKARFETKLEPHFHLCCVHCKAIEDLPLSREEIADFLKDKVTRRIQNFDLSFSGLCRSCHELRKLQNV
ncbi:MAG: transcriptional repressor [Lentisphaeria bacterium]|nr:transcriptional repressor [Lentisphaeria bacterium]